MATRRRRIVWTLRARHALDDAIGYVAANAPQAAERLLLRILEGAESLDQFSERGRMVPEIGDPQIRELVLPPYRLIYTIHEDEVHVLSLLHDRQEFLVRRDPGFSE